MGEYVCKIEKLQNGYEVEITDPAIVAANNKRATAKGPVSYWKDPKVSFAFKNAEEVCNFLRKNLDKATGSLDEYGTAFDAATDEDD